MAFWDFSRFSVHGDIQAVFDIAPPEDLLDREGEGDDEENRKQSTGIGKALLDGFNNQFGLSADAQNGGRAQSSRKSSANSRDKKQRRRESSIAQARSRSRSKSTDVKLRQEFADSESGEEGGDEGRRDHPKGYRKIKKGERLDSIMDFSDSASPGLQEANARLHKMEDSLQRLEDLVLQLVQGGSPGSEPAENELIQGKKAGVMD